MRYQQTRLWQSAFASRSNDPNADERTKLEAAYRSFWDNACELSRQIAVKLPGLTLHDERHFDALWERADQIAGPDYSLTPLEVFTLGGAILLHDIAHAIPAYSGGLEEIKSTPEWADAVADAGFIDGVSAEEFDRRSNVALFNTLRRLHAKRAEDIGTLKFSSKEGGILAHLIQDDLLRNHLSRIIGLLAASHHWDISDLADRLPPVHGAIGQMPAEWRIQPIKIACLLRCADAVQLDQQRTPDFLYAMLNMKGLSELHWRAQNRLAAPAVDPQDPSALVFTSTKAFAPSDAEAWWIAFEAIQVADRELSRSKALLKDLRLPTFAIDRIRNADSPSRITENLATSGWRPIEAEIKITRVGHVVQLLGGAHLYQDEYWAPLRELIQNSADAIRQRREIEQDPSYSGRINIRLEKHSDVRFTLYVEDNGLGMSEHTLTGPLIDFGSGYWSSEVSKIERPGFSRLESDRIGKFGIGFFSIFMLTDAVDVTSRPFDKGTDYTRTLKFGGLNTLRPLLLDETHVKLNPSISTKISISLDKQRLDKLLMLVSEHYADQDDDLSRISAVSVREIVSRICLCLDCDVYVEENGSTSLAHARDWHKQPFSAWLEQIFPECDISYFEYINGLGDLIDPSKPSLGRAAILLRPIREATDASGVDNIGGLSTGPLSAIGYYRDLPYTGSITVETDHPSRARGRQLNSEAVAAWATRQADAVHLLTSDPDERLFAAANIAQYGGEAGPLHCCKIGGETKTPEEFISLLKEGNKIYLPVRADTRIDTHAESYFLSMRSENGQFFHIDIQDLSTDLIILQFGFEYEHAVRNYGLARFDGPQSSASFLGHIEKLLQPMGGRLGVALERNFSLGTYSGDGSKRDKIRRGRQVLQSVALIEASWE